ncbi:uncharacterized protein LOC100519072 isoform X9 [Sus scrofa]|uniref:uncharacterized protein LOC100519072 isoform X9 n=1 Tax=Sus scrofa TaxID=9823 RepID=UPI000A2B114E|nr:uncharacterized protein LOC100519072 isoform X9 [Sus scrofa]
MCGCVWVCICALIGLFSCINLAFNLNVLLISHDIYIDLSILISEQHQREYEETEGREKSVAERRKLFEKPQGKNDVPEKIFVPQERNVMNKRQEEKEREEIMRKSQGIPVSGNPQGKKAKSFGNMLTHKSLLHYRFLKALRFPVANSYTFPCFVLLNL